MRPFITVARSVWILDEVFIGFCLIRAVFNRVFIGLGDFEMIRGTDGFEYI